MTDQAATKHHGDTWVKVGGTAGGAVIGFALGGPVGGLVGAALGFFGGKELGGKLHPLPSCSLTLTGDPTQTSSCAKGGVLGITAPAGGTVLSMSQSSGNLGHLEVRSNQGLVGAGTGGVANVMWKDAQGNAKSTQVTIAVT